MHDSEQKVHARERIYLNSGVVVYRPTGRIPWNGSFRAFSSIVLALSGTTDRSELYT